MPFDQGKLEKMKVSAFLPSTKANDAPQVSKSPEDTYLVQVNPSSYSLDHLLLYAMRQAQGSSGSDAVYNRSEPTTLKFDFLFDGTGAVPPPSERSDEKFDVMTEILKFNRVVYDYKGQHHRSRKVLLVWGNLIFPCALTSLNYKFTLFKPDGTPLRAVATASFQEARTDAERKRRENKSSPDLTHLREIQAGDTLPLLAHRIYGDAALYLEVARVNKLVNFRRLRAGSRIALPPVEKGKKAKEAKT